MVDQESVSSDIYDHQYYVDLNRGYEEFVQGKDFPLFHSALELAAPLGPSLTVLDVGCGRGEVVYLLAQRGCQVYGIDYSAAAVDIAQNFLRDKLVSNQASKISILQMDAKRLTFDNNTFDRIFMLDIVEHLYDKELQECFDEAWRVLKKNGRLIIHTSPNSLNMSVVKWLGRRFGMTFKSDAYHVNEQNLFSLKRHLEFRFNIEKSFVIKQKHYWYESTTGSRTLIRQVARAVDFFLDNPVSHTVIVNTPLNLLLGNDVYVVATPKK